MRIITPQPPRPTINRPGSPNPRVPSPDTNLS